MEAYLNEHKAMKLLKGMTNDVREYNVYQLSDNTIISNIKGIKVIDKMYNKFGYVSSIELTSSSVPDTRHLDAYTMFKPKETNLPVYYSTQGIIINTEFLNEIRLEEEILIISNYLEVKKEMC